MPAGLRKILQRHKVLITILTVAIGLILVFLIAAERSSKPVQAAPRPVQVEVAQVEQRDVPIYSEWIGTTDGMVNADIKAQVTGYLLRQDYKEGSFVKKGQLLFEIDSRPFQAVVNQAKGDLAKSESQVQQAVTQLDQALAQLAQANSQLMQAEANQ